MLFRSVPDAGRATAGAVRHAPTDTATDTAPGAAPGGHLLRCVHPVPHDQPLEEPHP